MANIKFFRKDVAPSNPQEGYIWFNSSNNTIQLYKNAWEVYTGKINNVTYTDGKLTIVPHVGDSTIIDLSAVANISDLSTRLGTLETSFNILSGEFATEKGKISALQGEMTTVKTEVAKLEGITDKVTSYVVGKIGEVETAYKAKDTELGNRIGALETNEATQNGRLDALEAFKNAEGGVVDGKISDAISALGGEKTGNGTYVDVTVKTVGGEVDTVTIDDTDLNTKLSGIETSVATLSSDFDKKLGGSYSESNTVAAAIQAAADAAAAAQADIDAWNSATEDTDGVIETIKELNTYITEHTDAFTGLSTRVGTAETDITNLKTVVDVKKVSTAISDAKTEAIDAAASDATAKADAAKSGAISEANTYTNEEVSKLANGAVNTNTTNIAIINGQITEINGQITAINTTIEENELV